MEKREPEPSREDAIKKPAAMRRPVFVLSHQKLRTVERTSPIGELTERMVFITLATS